MLSGPADGTALPPNHIIPNTKTVISGFKGTHKY